MAKKKAKSKSKWKFKGKTREVINFKKAPPDTHPPKTDKHVRLIICVECDNGRWCKAQDAWQVKRCENCQGDKATKRNEDGLRRLKARAKPSVDGTGMARYRPIVYVDKLIHATKAELQEAKLKVRKEMKQAKVKLPIWPGNRG